MRLSEHNSTRNAAYEDADAIIATELMLMDV